MTEQTPSDPKAALPKTGSAKDEFYVGYLPTPEGHRGFIVMLVALLLSWCVALSVVMVLTMRTPGIARWDTGTQQTWTGALIEHPYPMLVRDEGEHPGAMLVVAMGKRGAHKRLEGHYGRRVQLRGYQLLREGRALIELGEGNDAIMPVDTPTTPPPTIAAPVDRNQELVTLVGEIVDGKCYLGAMKPGEGIGHRSCAILCLRGGLPPMFVARTQSGDILYYLLIVDHSTTLTEEMLRLVGTPVRLRGNVALMHGIPILEADMEHITPYDPRRPEAMPEP